MARKKLDARGTALHTNSSGDGGLDELSEETGLVGAVLEALPAALNNVREKQNALTATSRALSQLLASQALAEATDTRQQQQQITMQLESLRGELNELQARWQVLSGGKAGATVAAKDTSGDTLVATGPLEMPDDTSGGSRWQTVMMTSSSETRESSSHNESSGSSEQWSCNVWIASASSSSTNASASSGSKLSDFTDTIDLGMRATLVTVDRGGWFQPQFFKESNAFYKVNPDISWVDGPKGSGIKGLMPGFPIAFLVVKDVTVRVVHSQVLASDEKKFEQSAAATSGGFLCFSYSSSKSSSSSSTASSFKQYSNGYVVKIPGPQILGYMVQELDSDLTTLMPAELPDNFFIPDDEFNETITGPGTQNGVNPGGPERGVDPNQDSEPKISQSAMQKMLDKMLNEKIGELFSAAAAEGDDEPSSSARSRRRRCDAG
ncbi:hypothetical protein B0H13DRAFT_2319601 [Mycena leptocephala]|nr:hypothetical protein B0H13DRAFT_2319601 [Mycena leptocephala]